MVIIVKIYTCGLYVKPQSSNPCRDHRCQGNGYRHRDLDTRVGTIEVAVPKLRAGSYDDTITELPAHHSGGLHLFRVAELTTVRESHRPVDSHAAHGHPFVVGRELPQSGPSLNGIGSRDVPKGGGPRCWPGRCAADRPPSSSVGAWPRARRPPPTRARRRGRRDRPRWQARSTLPQVRHSSGSPEHGPGSPPRAGQRLVHTRTSPTWSMIGPLQAGAQGPGRHTSGGLELLVGKA